MAQTQQQMRHAEREMVPTFLVQAMFALMIASTAIVAWAQWTDQPNTGVLQAGPIMQSRDVVLTGDRVGVYVVHDSDGTVLAVSNENKAGFIGVMGRVIDRERKRQGVTSEAPIQIVKRDNGDIGILDSTTGMAVELIGYGADNVAAFARLLD